MLGQQNAPSPQSESELQEQHSPPPPPPPPPVGEGAGAGGGVAAPLQVQGQGAATKLCLQNRLNCEQCARLPFRTTSVSPTRSGVAHPSVPAGLGRGPEPPGLGLGAGGFGVGLGVGRGPGNGGMSSPPVQTSFRFLCAFPFFPSFQNSWPLFAWEHPVGTFVLLLRCNLNLTSKCSAASWHCSFEDTGEPSLQVILFLSPTENVAPGSLGVGLGDGDGDGLGDGLGDGFGGGTAPPPPPPPPNCLTLAV